MSKCMDCVAGAYNKQPGLTKCTACDAGKFNVRLGLTMPFLWQANHGSLNWLHVLGGTCSYKAYISVRYAHVTTVLFFSELCSLACVFHVSLRTKSSRCAENKSVNNEKWCSRFQIPAGHYYSLEGSPFCNWLDFQDNMVWPGGSGESIGSQFLVLFNVYFWCWDIQLRMGCIIWRLIQIIC